MAQSSFFDRGDVRETITQSAETSVAWNLGYAQHHSSNLLIGGCYDMHFRPDGMKFYGMQDTGSCYVEEWDLSAPWDLSTATYVQEFDTTTEDNTARGVSFSPDGLKMYVLGQQNDTVDEYDLGTAWDVSTAVHLQGFSIAAKDGTPHGLYFREDGKRFYFSGQVNSKVFCYLMTTAWDVSTAVFLDEIAIAGGPSYGLTFSRDGLYMYFGLNGTTIERWALTTPFLVGSAAAESSFTVYPALGTNRAIEWKHNGSIAYVLGANTHIMYTVRRGWRNG